MSDMDRALLALTGNPVADLVLKGDANVGDVFEAASTIVAVACEDARGKRDKALVQQAKSANKLWGKFLEAFHSMALRARELP